ncbi:MAG: efflux RND transporter periplasmic adaptor subunit [Candidatus Moranbacteria bacterium]|nr:efflux RND transporter periplasmic adaptor subunit [Candidatus Moranbacteria bacterium]
MKNYLKNHKKLLAIVALVLIAGGYFWYSKSHSTTATVQYKTVVAQKSSITTSISGSGNVVVDQLATVDPTITGTVSNLSVNVGDKIKKGAVLFTIINADLSVSNNKAIASLQQAKNSVDSAELQIKQAEADYKAAKKDDSSTSDQRKILKEKIGIAENGLLASQKSYAANLSDYNNQISNSAKRTVTAPIDGTVSAINVKNGDDLSRLSSSSSSSAPIIIGDLSTLKAQVLVNEVDIPNVSIGQKVMMTFSAIDGLTVSGKVEKMDALGTISQGVVSYGVTISFDTIDSRIKPSMSVSAKIITQVKQDVITVSNSALKVQGNKTYVEVLKNGSQTPEKRTIEVGANNNTETEIVSGINVGDSVVTQTIDPNAKTTTSTTSTNRAGGGMGILGGR